MAKTKKKKRVQVSELGVEPGSVAASVVNGGDQTLSFVSVGGESQGEEETGRGRETGGIRFDPLEKQVPINPTCLLCESSVT